MSGFDLDVSDLWRRNFLVLVGFLCSMQAANYCSEEDGVSLAESDSRIFTSPQAKEIGWVGLAAAAETVQTLLGLVDVSFPILMTRRAFILFGRGCLFCGILQR